MSKLIQAGNLRAPVGQRDKGYRIYIPRLFENQDYILPSRNATILKGCLRYRSSRFNEAGRRKIQTRLMTEFGLRKSLASVFASRRTSEIKRIEQTIHGIVDSLLLFDTELFVTKVGEDHVRFIIRRILTIGVFNIPLVVKWWKDYVNHVFIDFSQSETIERPKRDSRNFFFCLDSWPKIQRIRFGTQSDKKSLSDLAHLISSRQLPTGDRRVEELALQKFEKFTTEMYHPDSEILYDLYQAARIIGRKCRKAGPGPERSAHISLAASGSLFNNVESGGRAKEILDFIIPYLSEIPLESRTITLPFISLSEVKGVPRWRTWCRDQTYEEFPDTPFGELTQETLAGFTVFRQGFDEAIGTQILCCAYVAMQHDTQGESSILLRVLTITEPGCKARIVTTGPWWLYVLQQSQAHVTRAFLASHPSAESGLMRTDQAWQYLYPISKARPSFKDDMACLSSDLTSATDVIPRKVAVQLLQGFIDGVGYTGPLVDVAVEIVKRDRLCIVEQTGTAFLATRGVFMGEPLAKTILTLLNLSCEEVAIRRHLKVNYRHPVQVPWRCFSVAGDDHIAIGPKGYLREITRTHIRAGSKISPEKHAISSIAVRYCEKILDIRNIRNLKWTPVNINNASEFYLESPFVDSVKVRLLSPCSKSNENFNDRNTAVGKAKSLGNTLRWLHRPHFSIKWVSMVRDRFFTRMGSLLPDRSSGVYWHLLLPEVFGGLGLWLEEDIPDLAIRLPSPSKRLIVDIPAGKLSSQELTNIRGFTANASYRGYELVESEVSLVREFIIQDLYQILQSGTAADICAIEEIPTDISLKQKLSRLKKKGWLTAEELEDQLLRPFLFKEIFSQEAKVMAFNTETFKRRYAKLWDIYFDGHSTVSEVAVKAALTFKTPWLLYHRGEKFPIPVRGELLQLDLVEEATVGLPDLKIRWSQVGMLTDPTGAPLEEELSTGHSP
jgi:hypothetical protein